VGEQIQMMQHRVGSVEDLVSKFENSTFLEHKLPTQAQKTALIFALKSDTYCERFHLELVA
jgi:hypothetical protein